MKTYGDYYEQGYMKAITHIAAKGDDLSNESLIEEYDKRDLPLNSDLLGDEYFNKYALAVLKDYDELSNTQKKIVQITSNRGKSVIVWVKNDYAAEIKNGLSGYEIKYDENTSSQDLDLMPSNQLGLMDWIKDNDVDFAGLKWKDIK